MKKKFKLMNIMPHILAAATVIIVVIACGEGDIINVDNDYKTKRELEIADAELGRKLDSLADERMKSSVVQLPSSGIDIGESSASDSTIVDVSSSAGADVSSSSIAEISSSSEDAPSGSSDSYELVCQLRTNKIVSVSRTEFDFENSADSTKIPFVKCIRQGHDDSTDSTDLEIDDVAWSRNGTPWRWDQVNSPIKEDSVVILSIFGRADAEECFQKTADCAPLMLCLYESKKGFCQSSSSVVASSSSGDEVDESSSSVEKVSSSSSETGSSSSNNCTQLTLKDGVYQTPRTTVVTPAGACYSFSCTGNLEAGYVGGSSKKINVPVCGDEDYTIIATGNGSFSSSSTVPIPYTSICPTSGDVQVFIKEQLSSTTQYFNFKCSTPTSSSSAGTGTSSNSAAIGCSISGSYDIVNLCISVSSPSVTNCATPTNLQFKVGSTTADAVVPVNQSATSLGQFCNARSAANGKVWLTGGSCGTAITTPIECGSITITKPLTCDKLPQETGTVGSSIDKPIVKCGTTTLNSGVLTWTNAPNWDTPAEGKYSDISVSASCDSKTRSASCAGEIDVLPAGATTYTAACSWTAGSGKILHSGDARPANPTITCTPSTGAANIPGTVDASGLPPAGNLSASSTTTYTPDQTVIKCDGEAPTNAVSCGTLTVHPKLACYGAVQTIRKGETPAKPTATCGGTIIANGTGVTWTPNVGAAISTVQNATVIKATATCGDEQTVNCTTSSTSTTNTTITVTPTLTCEVAKSAVTQGENIGPPKTLTCSDAGTANKNATNTTFGAPSGSTAPTGIANWKTTGNAYYPGTVTGNQSVQVSGVTCTISGTVYTPPGNTSCGIINVSKPTCSGVSGSVTVGDVITPTVSCGGGSASSTTKPTFTGGTGWSANSNGGGSFTSAGQNLAVNLSSITCDDHAITGITGQSCGTVNVTAITYTITFNANGGTNGATTTQTKTHDVALTLTTDKPTRTGYTFAGWNTAQDGTGTSYPSGGSYPASNNANATLYAKWTSGTACDFQQSWCPSIDWETGIKWGEAYTAPSNGNCACFFLDKKGGNTAPSCSPYNSAVCTINGEAGGTQNIPLKDGGYYLYGCSTSNGVPNASNADTFKAKPSCTPTP
jgi:uncharacterized repeat protein (TIGR02543 family)